jgi:ABC-type transport system substrate-binding protein
VDYIHLAKNKNYWRTPVKPVDFNIFEISDSHASIYEDDSIL